MKKVQLFILVWMLASYVYLYHIPKNQISIHKPFQILPEGELRFQVESEFFKSLPTLKPRPTNRFVEKFFVIGQIVSQSIPSGSLIGKTQLKIILSKQLNKEIGLNDFEIKPGFAYGTFELPKFFLDFISENQSIQVSYYSIRNLYSNARIIHVYTNKDLIRIIFSLSDGKEWYPGANCEIHIPGIAIKPFNIPNNAIVHNQGKDVVYVKKPNGIIIQKPVSIVFETKEDFEVLGLEENDEIIYDKAILLKPLFSWSLISK